MPACRPNQTLFLALMAVVAASACNVPEGPPGQQQQTPPDNNQQNNVDPNKPAGLAVLGNYSHSTDSVEVTEIGNQTSGLFRPRDVAFKPGVPGEMWVVNERDNSIVIFKNTGTPDQTSDKRSGPGGTHFMPKPSAMAFGKPGFMATVHDMDQVTEMGAPADFMGPTLWTTDDSFEGGHASHYDMLHNSPDAVGIAWDHDNVYWVFDGYHRSITKYDFQDDHGPAGSDHSDGIAARYVNNQMSYEKGVSSHMELDHATGLLYIADSGNGRIAVLDTKSGTKGTTISPNYDGGPQYYVTGATLTTLVSSLDVEQLQKPSGLALHDGKIWVSDNRNALILAFDLDGKLVDWLDLGSFVSTGSLMGMDFDSQGRLYVVDAVNHKVFRIAPKPANAGI
jgi:hypothetical protein